MRKNISVNMVKTRSITEQKAKEKVTEEPTVPARETDLETPDQSIDAAERKTTESTPRPNVEEQEKKTREFSLIGIVDETTNSTSETIKDDSQTKRTSCTERIAAMVGMKPKEKEEVLPREAKRLEQFSQKLQKLCKTKSRSLKEQWPTKTNKPWNQKQLHLSWAT